MPGTYIAGEPVVTIAAFAPQLHVITSKQRPRKLTIHGSDGAEYVFLLKVSSLGSGPCTCHSMGSTCLEDIKAAAMQLGVLSCSGSPAMA